eukprot:TRINITY_DN53006_c0_g1_i1.p1 TRINITY_DN53006_c0_g1~~TRINITY_DN53006_c0_g1_i1.p1  ORF type:complete len:271 (-),score=17.99 TRINITY_DN53006_c0_g1_i1:172-984(-)
MDHLWSWTLVSINLLLHALLWYTPCKKLLKRCNEFEGSRLKTNGWFLLITPTFFHANMCHVTNNMLMLLGYTFYLEQQIGGPALWALYILTGAAGWLAMYAWSRYQHGEIGDFVPSTGSSPATYGLNALAALLCWNCQPPPTEAWFWFVLLWLLPFYVFVSRQTLPGTLTWTVLSLATFGGVHWFGVELNAINWWWLYLLKTFIWRVREWLMDGRNWTTADNAAHLGGTVVGLFVGFLYLGSTVVDMPMQAVLLHVACVVYLLARLLFNC